MANIDYIDLVELLYLMMLKPSKKVALDYYIIKDGQGVVIYEG